MAQRADQPEVLRSVSSIRHEREQRLLDRYGGFSWGADFLGFAVATFLTVVLFGVVGAVVGSVGYQMNASVPKPGAPIAGATQTLGVAGLIGGLVAIFIAYLLGGYAAGRMARFNGALNGLGVVIWTVVVAILLGIPGGVLGSRFNVGSQLNMHIDTSTLGAAGAVSLVITLLVMALAAMLGGKMGAAYHRSIDRDAGLT